MIHDLIDIQLNNIPTGSISRPEAWRLEYRGLETPQWVNLTWGPSFNSHSAAAKDLRVQKTTRSTTWERCRLGLDPKGKGISDRPEGKTHVTASAAWFGVYVSEERREEESTQKGRVM